MRVIFESDTLCVRLRDGHGSEQLVVTFAGLGAGFGAEAPGFAEGFCDRHGLDAVHVLCRGDDWYQYADMPEALDAVADAGRGYGGLVTYGASMGGYQAVKAAGRLGARRCVAVSPQISIDPAKAPWETRWTETARRLDFIDDEIASGPATDYVLILDPFDRTDRLHARAIGGIAPTRELPIPFGGHAPLEVLRDAGTLAAAILPLLRDEDGLAEARRRTRAARWNSTTWLVNVSRAGRLPAAWRETALRRAVALSPQDAWIRQRLAALLSAEGRTHEAVACAADAVRLLPDEPRLEAFLAKLTARSARKSPG